MRSFPEKSRIEHAYVITQRWDDFRILPLTSAHRGQTDRRLDTMALAIPAPLACFWLS